MQTVPCAMQLIIVYLRLRYNLFMNGKRLIRSFEYALKGVVHAFCSQQNARIHLAAAVIAIAMGFVFHISTIEWIAIIIVIAMVFAAELINTSIEMLTDKVSPDYDPNAGKIKDMAAAAVLIMAIAALITGLIIFIPKIYQSL